jgi:perosamine synthetase
MGQSRKFFHPLLGFNYKMSDIHAAIGLAQLPKLDGYIKKKRENIKYIREQVDNSNLKLPSEREYAFSVYYVCHVLAKKGKDRIVTNLQRKGIETRPLLSLIPEQPCYQTYKYKVNEYRVAQDAHRKGFYISNSPLLSKKELDYLTTTLNKSLK